MTTCIAARDKRRRCPVCLCTLQLQSSALGTMTVLPRLRSSPSSSSSASSSTPTTTPTGQGILRSWFTRVMRKLVRCWNGIEGGFSWLLDGDQTTCGVCLDFGRMARLSKSSQIARAVEVGDDNEEGNGEGGSGSRTSARAMSRVWGCPVDKKRLDVVGGVVWSRRRLSDSSGSSSSSLSSSSYPPSPPTAVPSSAGASAAETETGSQRERARVGRAERFKYCSTGSEEFDGQNDVEDEDEDDQLHDEMYLDLLQGEVSGLKYVENGGHRMRGFIASGLDDESGYMRRRSIRFSEQC